MSLKTIASVVVLVLHALGIAHAADRIVPPAVPSNIEAGAGYRPFLWGHAVGTQNYICAPAATASGVDWLFIGPQATIFGPEGQQILTHFQSKNPFQGDAIQATWQTSRDSSAVWATKHSGSTDPLYVSPNAIEWLLLDVTGTQFGPDGGDKLARTLRIQRVNTVGGVKPPAADCTAATVNTRRLVAYEADYYFYR